MANITLGNQSYEELMGGCAWYDAVCHGKKVVKGTVKIVMAPVKGVTHTGMEIYRGVKSGDIKKVFKAPFKGAGHTFMETWRGSKKVLSPTLAPFDLFKDAFKMFMPKPKAPKGPDKPAFTPLPEDEGGGFPIIPIIAVGAAAVGGYFMLKG